ncbi:nucleotide-binding protein [Porphyromonas levii]|uniref:ParA family protein n=1 Tax=Porphyromonas levii TaxID=28114 RepID=A0A4Y8WNV2_9PORP|nr:P-loop NTPase [Porphyromonas levii]TFH94049.1 ParA family protein [Porphyromonas levii]TFH95188.1 ParA family protein [Porphyromonas levii]
MDKKRIAVSGIKGGTGKSTIAMVLGVILRESYDKKVCLVDCDEYQSTLTNQMKAEESFFSNNPDIAEKICAARNREVKYSSILPVEKLDKITEENILEIEKKHDDCDVFIFDTKGSEGDLPFFRSLTLMDYIVLPIILDKINSQSAFTWIKGFNYVLGLEKAEVRNKGICLLSNKIVWGDIEQAALSGWWQEIARAEGVFYLETGLKMNTFVGKSIDKIKGENDSFFESISIVPDDVVLRMSNAGEVVKNIITFVDSKEEKRIRKVPSSVRVKAPNVGQPSNILDLIDERIEILNRLSEQVKTNSLVASKYHSIHDCLMQFSVSQLEYLMRDMPPLPGVERRERGGGKDLIEPLENNGTDEFRNVEGSPDVAPRPDDNDTLDEVDKRAIALFTDYLRSLKSSSNQNI